jgi:hypothetical protein
VIAPAASDVIPRAGTRESATATPNGGNDAGGKDSAAPASAAGDALASASTACPAVLELAPGFAAAACAASVDGATGGSDGVRIGPGALLRGGVAWARGGAAAASGSFSVAAGSGALMTSLAVAAPLDFAVSDVFGASEVACPSGRAGANDALGFAAFALGDLTPEGD